MNAETQGSIQGTKQIRGNHVFGEVRESMIKCPEIQSSDIRVHTCIRSYARKQRDSKLCVQSTMGLYENPFLPF